MNADTHNRAQTELRSRSASTTKRDPYRAGVELAEQLAEIEPEVIFLFLSIHYEGSPELVEAIYDVLGNRDLVLIGTTGEGFYEKNRVADVGASALALHTGGAITWRLAHESGVGQKPREATLRCLDRLRKECSDGPPALYYLATDFRTDTCEIITALNEGADAPVVGGSAADDGAIQSCFVYANREVLTDCVALLAFDGPLAFDILVANNPQPMGRTAPITESSGTTVSRIDGIPAMDFIEREIGKPIDTIDEGVITLKLTEQGNDEQHMIRSVLIPSERGSGVMLFGGVRQMNQAQVCLAPSERMIQEVTEIGDSLAQLDFDPVAALIVSCAGRKKVLAGEIEREVRDIVVGAPGLSALAGFPSFGEFGPLKTAQGFSPTLYHNMTFLLIVMGNESKAQA